MLITHSLLINPLVILPLFSYVDDILLTVKLFSFQRFPLIFHIVLH